MEKTKKKITGSTIAILVLSVLLVLAFSAVGTLAWFAGKDSGSKTLTMGKAVHVRLTDGSTNKITFTLGEGRDLNNLLPGQNITADSKAELDSNGGPAYLRVKITVDIAEGTGENTLLKNQFDGEVKKLLNSHGWSNCNSDGYYYYLKSDAAANDEEVAASTKMLEVAAGTTVDMLTGKFRIPTAWTNAVANKTITFTIDVEAIQSYIEDASGNRVEFVDKVAEIFEEAKAGGHNTEPTAPFDPKA